MRREPWPDALALPSLELLEPRLLLAGASGSVDLVVTAATAPASASLGDQIEVIWTVSNQGTADALGPWTDAVYFSDDAVLNLPQGEEEGGDYRLASVMSEGLAADQTYTVTYSVGLPDFGSGGTCYLLFVTDADDNVPEAGESNNVRAVPIDIIPPDVDLTVTAAAAPELLRLSDSFDVSWTVTNQGSQDVWQYWQDMVFYSADSVLDPGDVRLGYTNGGGGGEGGLPGGGTYNSNLSVSLPGGLPAGPAHLLIVTDATRRIAETDEANNAFDLPITVTVPGVDLQVTGAAAPPSGLLGGAVSVSWTVKNFGAEEAIADWYDSIYVSSDATLDPGDVFAEHVWIGGQTPLAGGASYTIANRSVSIPNGAPTGAVYLLFVADRSYYAESQNLQGETDETNNVVARPITLTPPDVDLVITATTAPDTVLVGQYLTVSWTGKNQGGAATQQSYWYDHVYYSDDAVLDKRDALLAYGSVSRAAPSGGTYAISDVAITIPATAAPGAHYLLFVADGYNYQAETNEANNVLVVPVAVEQPAADLAITGVTVPASVLVGQPVSLSWKGVNQGTTATTAQVWYDAVYYSEDDVLDESDPGATSALIWGPVAPGAAYDSGSTTAYIPATATPGTRYLFLRADAYDYQPETDETNNVYRVEINVASADLAVKAATAPAAATLGDTISVSWTVANQGAGAATNWSDGVYISKKTVFDGSAISLLSERLAGPVAPGAEYARTRNVTLPNSLSGGGAYYLLFVADKANELKEPDETNNVLALPIDIRGADLVVTAASVVPTSSSLGATVHIAFTVENQGTAPAPGANWGGSYGWGWWDSVYLSAYPDLNHPNVMVDVGWNTLSTPLAAGATYTVERDVALPNSLPPGELYLLFAIDQTQWYGSLQGEIDETNNLRVVPLTLGGPDLVVSAASAPASVALSSVVEVSRTVANVGAEPARGTWIDALYFSTDPVLSVNDYFVTSASNPAALPAGGNYIDTRTVFIPTVPLGDYYLLFVTNEGFWQGETDTTNNVRALPIKIVAPDLVVTEATAPASAIVGQKINVSWTVANQGEAWAYSAWYDSVWISTDPFVDNWDKLAGQVDQAAHRMLAAGATYTTSRTVTVPNVGVGDFYILFVADRRYDGYSLQGESNEMNNTLALPIHIQAPDLQVTAATAPETAVVNSTVLVSYTVANTGTVMAPATWVDAVYLSEDAFRGYDTMLGRWSNGGWTPLAAGASYTMTRWITLPTSAIGQKYLLFVADDGTGAGTQGETDEANNLRAVPILVVSPDLVVSAASASASSASPGDTVSVSWTVLNQGTTPAPADWYDYVYLSKDATLDGGDVEARKESIWAPTPLAAGAAYTINRNITIPNFEPGDWYLLFVADRLNQQGETNENNNVRAVPITVTVPDLKLTAASAPSAATLSGTISVSWTVANIGTVAAQTHWYDAVYLSTDATWDAYDESLDYKDAGANVPLAPGASYTADLTFQVPEFQTGPCWLIFVVDDNEWQAESDETNNTFALPITLSAPDLAVAAATAPASAILGQTVDVSWTVTNQGLVDTAANWVDQVYLSRSATFDGATRWLATVAGKPLAAGADYLATATVTIPDVGTGAFYFLFVADGDGDQAETNENNNVRAAPITLGAPDFVVTGAGAPALATFGQTVDVSWTVANQGAAPTAVPAWYDSLYLSRDSTFSGDDIWLASVDESGQAPLAPGASYTAGHTLAIPDVGTGDFYWLFVADRHGIANVQGFNNLQAETDETNNVFAVPMRVETPDLEMTAVAAPATGVVGGAVEVSWTVTNTGSVPALADWTDAVYLSSDPNLDLGDWELVAWSAAARTPLAAGDHYDVTQTVLVPSLGVGPKYLIFVTDRDSDQGEAGEANNLRVVPIQIAAPDLVVTAASAAVPSASLGAPVSVSWTVLNQGAAEAPAAWSDAVFLSADPVWDGSDVLVATVDASAHAMLAAGSSYTLTRTVAIPDFALGDQYLLFYADRGNKQGETNENNNAFAVPVHLTAADLQIANLTVTPAALKSGDYVTIRWEDVNTGAGPTPGRFYDRIVVRNATAGQTLHAAMVAYEPGPGERIDPGQSLAREYVYRLPDGPPGVGQIQVTVTTDGRQDAGIKGDVIEDNASGTGETNNAASAGATSVLAPYPDLAVTDILVLPEAVSGQLVPITWTVANLGDGPAVGPWGDTVFLSADTTAGGDQWLGAFGFDGTLAPGQSLTRSQVVFVPITSAGDWHVVVETNSGRAFYEHATANNTLVAGGLLTVRMAPLPNLQVEEITPPTRPFAGQQTVIEWTVTNTGTGSTNAAAWTDGVWLSTDATWGGGDRSSARRRTAATSASARATRAA